jgi:hypothetical protein
VDFTLLELNILALVTPVLLPECAEGVGKFDQFVADIRLRSSLQLVMELFILLSLGGVLVNLAFSILLKSLSNHIFFLEFSLGVR